MSAEIYKALKFVQGAVSRKELVPGMTHFAIEDGAVRAYNGNMGLCHPIPVDFACKPRADKLVPAISNCDKAQQAILKLTPTGRLSIKSGGLTYIVDCLDEKTPHVSPEGEIMEFDGEALLKAFEVVSRFIGTDASRQWQTGVLLRGKSAFATCNVVLVEYWHGFEVPLTINIPGFAIKEMLRIGRPPTHAQVHTHSITFHYGENCWLRSQLLDTNWPDLQPLLDRQVTALPINEELFDGLDKIRPFCDKGGRVFFQNGVVTTHPEEEIERASFDMPGFNTEGIYNVEMLSLLNGVATHIDFTGYPGPCTFYGDRLRGVIIGMRKVVT